MPNQDSNVDNLDVTETPASTLVDWENPPTIGELTADLKSAKVSHDVHTAEVDDWLRTLNAEQTINAKQGRSKLVPKLVRKQAEWRYAALSEPFLSTDDIFNTEPTTYEDKDTAVQNGMVLNYQLNHKIDKISFIDDYVRTAVDEGTVIVRVEWEFEEAQRMVKVPIIERQLAIHPETGQIILDPTNNQPVFREITTGHKEELKTVTVKNQPSLTICDYNNIVLDPTCNGDIDKANFAIYSFETSLAELKKDKRYKNLDNINFEGASVLAEPDHKINSDDSAFTFQDKPRKKVIAREYWGFWDIDGSGEVTPIVAVWIGSTFIRLEKNPYPDKKLPFVLVPYLPRRKHLYGEPDASLIDDNQRVIGAVTRGIMDILGRSANAQEGVRKDALDVTNSRKYERGEDYKFNANIDPKTAFHMGTYPEIPRSAIEVLQMQNNDAEALTGVKAFTDGISGQALGTTATGIRSALDATSKRELGILRRLSNGLKQIGRKIMSMNAEFLDDQEIIRITNEEFVTISRDDLGGEYDIKLDISTAEADEQKAGELSFMLQTLGPNAPAEMTNMLLSEIAALRKMPDLAKKLKDFKPTPDPLQQRKAEADVALVEAQVDNERAKAEENTVDIDLKRAKADTERAKARHFNANSDKADLDFVERDSGVDNAREQEAADRKHAQTMQEKEHDRVTALDKAALDGLQKDSN